MGKVERGKVEGSHETTFHKFGSLAYHRSSGGFLLGRDFGGGMKNKRRFGPVRSTRLAPADDRYLMALAAKFKIKPSWYIRSAVEEWIQRRREKGGNRR
jgi:hypothetical protein